MGFKKIVSAYIIFLTSNLIGEIGCVDYYWKNFNGDIPDDAVLGGDKVYVGLGLGNDNLKYGLIPATIRPDESAVYIPIDHQGKPAHIAKILCSQKKKAFKWVETSSATLIDDLTDRVPVEGGMELDTVYSYHSRLFVGRYNNYIGKIVVDADQLLYYVNNTEAIAHIYEILVYTG